MHYIWIMHIVYGNENKGYTTGSLWYHTNYILLVTGAGTNFCPLNPVNEAIH